MEGGGVGGAALLVSPPPILDRLWPSTIDLMAIWSAMRTSSLGLDPGAVGGSDGLPEAGIFLGRGSWSIEVGISTFTLLQEFRSDYNAPNSTEMIFYSYLGAGSSSDCRCLSN